MIETTITRVHTAWFGQSVLSIARQLSSADFYLEKDDPGEDDTKKGVGKWAIKLTTERPLDYGAKSRLDRVVREAITFALADEIERLDRSGTNRALNGMWMLQPANRKQVYATARSLEHDLIIQPK